MRERIAELQHEQWSGWMKYLFEKCEINQVEGAEFGVIPAWAVERWTRQANTPYTELPEDEKESDRIEADKYILLVAEARREALNTCLRFAQQASSDEQNNPANLVVMDIQREIDRLSSVTGEE
jgi:hypothetical protein